MHVTVMLCATRHANHTFSSASTYEGEQEQHPEVLGDGGKVKAHVNRIDVMTNRTD